VNQSLIGSRFRAACTRAKLDGLHFHDLRHEAASRFLEAGAALHEVQAILGHTNIQQTSAYLNASNEGLSAAMEKRYQADIRRTPRAVSSRSVSV
jgi:integrase